MAAATRPTHTRNPDDPSRFFRASAHPASLIKVDGRSSFARRYRDLVDGLMASIPGDLSEPDKLQVRNAASLQLHAEELTARMCRGEAIDPESITRAVNGANRAIARLQKGRKAPRAGASSVSDYLARRREGAAQ